MKMALLILILLGTPALVLAQTAAPVTTRPADDVLYDDPTGTSTATITQVLSTAPSATPSNTTVSNVRRILIKQDVLIIQWGETATTLLPRQFVAGIAVNRRTPRE